MIVITANNRRDLINFDRFRLEEACTKLWHQAEIITECLAYRVQLYNSAKSDVLFMSGNESQLTS